MRVCIENNCYQVIRVIKNGASYEKPFLDNARDNCRADTMLNDNNGNILLCKRMLNYELNEASGKWVCVDDIPREPVMENSPVNKKVKRTSRKKRNKRK
jgi:hypothetical protein